MANVQVTLDADASGINPAWLTLRSEREDDATARKILQNELSRRFATKPGTYFTNPGYGLDVEDILGAGLVPGAAERLALEMVEQAKDDERVQDAAAEVESKTWIGSSVRIRVKLRIVPRIGEAFALTVSVNNLSVSTLKGER